MSLDYAILGFLSEKPGTGYDLKNRCFDTSVASFWTADQAQIYRTLDRLQERRLVSSRVRRQAGRPDRRVYEITPSGRDALWAWLESASPHPAPRDAFALQLYFGAELSDDDLRSLLAERRSSHQQRLERLRSESAAIAHARDGLTERTRTLRLTAYDGSIARERASIDWLDDCIHALEQGALAGSGHEGTGQRHLFGS